MASELDDFLDVEVPSAAVAADPAPRAAAVVDTPAAPEPVESKPQTEPAAPAKPEEEDEGVDPDDLASVKSAMVTHRRKAADHKGRADRLEGELAAYKAQVEAERARAAEQARPQPAQQSFPTAPPDPIADPAGNAEYWESKRFNDQLNFSEIMLRSQLNNDADIDAKIAAFKQAMGQNPALAADLKRQLHPYKWAYEQGARLIALDEIGPDPLAYRERLKAEARAEYEADLAGGAAAASGVAVPGAAPRVRLPQSLGQARSAGRNVPVINVPEDFDEILAPRRKRG